MNRIRRAIVQTVPATFASVLAVAISAHAGPSSEPTLDNFLTTTANTLERAQFLEWPEKIQLEQLLSEGVELQKLLTERASTVPPEFRQSIAELTEIVQKINSRGVSVEINIQNLALVLRDLQIKRDHLRHSFGGFPFKKSLKILVQITTFRDGHPSDGYEVAFNPLRLAAEQQPRYPVSSTTNSARRELPPGLYVMTLKRVGTEIIRPVEIGENGSDEQTIRVDL